MKITHALSKEKVKFNPFSVTITFHSKSEVDSYLESENVWEEVFNEVCQARDKYNP